MRIEWLGLDTRMHRLVHPSAPAAPRSDNLSLARLRCNSPPRLEDLLARAAGAGGVAGPGLAMRAEVATAPRDHDATDGLAAAPAGLAGMLIDAQFAQEGARAALHVEVIAESGAAQSYRPAQDPPNRLVEAVCLLARDAAGL